VNVTVPEVMASVSTGTWESVQYQLLYWSVPLLYVTLAHSGYVSPLLSTG
jgi:hypothetical protein